ncbi:hypothetical protein HU200_050468 [Digitaria exilis]|uniref:MADS-box domain-containing protein n=1 Tax=Digitaria exilis TaxID=1010633 RepID=A0A835E7K2_9POAL|nr:hypothetical protein HU200_050468 [Digitaria exilis]
MVMKPAKKTSKGRQKIEIRYIEDPEKRQVTLCKRKGGLMKKCSELHFLSGAHVALAIFSKKEETSLGGEAAGGTGRRSRGGSVSAMGPPPSITSSAATPARRTWRTRAQSPPSAPRELEETKALADAEKNRMDAIGDKVVGAAEAAGKRFWWEVDVEALGEAELPEFARALQRVREVVQREAGKLEVSAPAAAVSGRRRGNRRE